MSDNGKFQDQCIIRQGVADKSEIERLTWLWPQKDHGCWEGPMLNWNGAHCEKWFSHLKNRKVAVQAGGGCGMYPRLLASRFELVYTFEPAPLNFHCLVNNCQQENVIKINAALGGGPGRGTITLQNSENFGQFVLSKDGTGNTLIVKLDALELEACDLIALDVEGCELDVLHGAQSTIKRYFPVIVMELGDRQEIVSFMNELGYHNKEVSAMDVVWWI